MHPFLRFWSAAYRPYALPAEGPPAFLIPAFPGGLTSPRFWDGHAPVPAEAAHLNLVGEGEAPAGYACTHKFSLGTRRSPFPAGPAGGAAAMPLNEALREPWFWELLAEGFPGDLPFLRSFLPLLPALPARFFTVRLEEAGRPAAMITVGFAGGVGLCMNAAVARPARGRGLSQALVERALALARREEAEALVFWTEHGFLLRHADSVVPYRVFARVGAG